MAQAAQALDSSGAAANLRRSRVATQRQRQAPRKRGQVLNFPGGRPVSSQLREAEIYNQGTPEENRVASEAQNREKWMRDKIQQRQNHQSFVNPPKEYRELSREMQQEPEMMSAYQEYRAEASSILTQDRLSASAFRERLQTVRRLSAASQQLSEKIKKIRQAIQVAKEGKDFAFSAYSIASVAETEGALAETANVSGILISWYRGAKTLFMPQAQFSTDPEAGQFFKGLLSYFEPGIYFMSKPSGWLGAIHGAYGYLILFAILATALAMFIEFAIIMFYFDALTDVVGSGLSALTASGDATSQIPM